MRVSTEYHTGSLPNPVDIDGCPVLAFISDGEEGGSGYAITQNYIGGAHGYDASFTAWRIVSSDYEKWEITHSAIYPDYPRAVLVAAQSAVGETPETLARS
jgi:hypothetical protein